MTKEQRKRAKQWPRPFDHDIRVKPGLIQPGIMPRHSGWHTFLATDHNTLFKVRGNVLVVQEKFAVYTEAHGLDFESRTVARFKLTRTRHR